MTDNAVEMKNPGPNNIMKINEAVLEKRIDEKIREASRVSAKEPPVRGLGRGSRPNRGRRCSATVPRGAPHSGAVAEPGGDPLAKRAQGEGGFPPKKLRAVVQRAIGPG